MTDEEPIDTSVDPASEYQVTGEERATAVDVGDTTMAAGPRSGASGVANAELGTSGAPASSILTPEELAQTEVTGGAGLSSEAAHRDRLEAD